MRYEWSPQAVFCSQCGAKLPEVKPPLVRESSIVLIRRSYWYYIEWLIGVVMTCAGVMFVLAGINWGFAGLVLGIVTCATIPLSYRRYSWRITSDRLIEYRGLLANNRREMELQDIRSIEVHQRVVQRLVGTGDVTVSSAARADFLVRLDYVQIPKGSRRLYARRGSPEPSRIALKSCRYI